MRSDIIVVGGGASGLMAAIGAADALSRTENGGTVTVLEKMPKVGRKVMLTGKGRCNLTNVKAWDEWKEHVATDSQFLSPSFHNFTPENLLALMKENGLRCVVEHGDRAFPESHMAGDVVDTLLRTCTLAGVKVVTGCEVKSVSVTPRGFSLDCVVTTVKKFETVIEPEKYSCGKLIIATGGLSYPGTGSTGDGMKWASETGHTVTPLFPSLTAIVPKGYKDLGKNPLTEDIREAFRGRTAYGKKEDIREAFRGRTAYGKKVERKPLPLPSHYPSFGKHIERITPLSPLGEMLCGNNLDNVAISLFINGDLVKSEFGDLEFTDGGLEGAIGFRVSRKAVIALENGQKVSVSIDMKPAVDLEKLDVDVHEKWQQVITDPRSKGQPFQKLFRIMLGKLIPWNITGAFLKMNPRVSVDTLASFLKDWRFDIEGFVGFERAVITAGGVSTKEVSAKTMESRKVPGMYFAGEVLDMDCDTGGYNLQAAFSTGMLAGQSAAASL